MKKLSLREIQLTELELLIEFDKIARLHNFKYSIICGTLIGAVRHQGFIPWDDDIDISMSRPEYERLLTLNREQNLWPSYIELRSFEDGTMESPYIKIFDTRTETRRDRFYEKDGNSLWIDIFPVDGLPEDEKKIAKHYKRALFLADAYIRAIEKKGYGSNKGVAFAKDHLIKPLLRLIGSRRLSEKIRKLALKYPYETSPKCGMITSPFDGPGQALLREEYEQHTEVSFEGHSFYTMAAWDKELRGIFGDYMKLPPEEERISHELEAYRL